MTYLRYQQLKPEDFKRLCGVHHQTFARMASVLEEQVEQQKQKQGLPSKFSIEDQGANQLGVLERVPDVLPHRTNLGTA